MPNISYSGSDKWKTKATEVLSQYSINKANTDASNLTEPENWRDKIGIDDVFKAVQPFLLTSSVPKTFTFKIEHKAMILIGFAQGIGSIILAITADGTENLAVTNLITGESFSNTNLTITAPTSTTLRIASSKSSESHLTAILEV